MSELLATLYTLCADMWEKPIAEFTTVFYNGDEAAKALNLENCTTFGSDDGQTVEIYDGRQVIYSCSVTEIFKKPVITSVYSKLGKVFEADYNTLYNTIEAQMGKYLFTVEWKRGSINSAIIKELRNSNINYTYNKYGELFADIYGDEVYSRLDYEHISGDIYGIFEKDT